MSLVITIILFVILFVKITSEKAGVSTTRREYAEQREIRKRKYEDFKNKHEDVVLEHEVKVNGLIQEDARKLIIENTDIKVPSFDMIRMIAMAKHGKIPSEFFDHMIGASSEGDAVENQAQWNAELSFLKYYDVLLRSHGCDEDLILYRHKPEADEPRPEHMPVHNATSCSPMYATWDSLINSPYLFIFGRNIMFPYCIGMDI